MDRREPPEAKGAHRADASLELQREQGPADTLTLGFWLVNGDKIPLCCLSHPGSASGGPSKVTEVKEGQSGHARREGLSRQRDFSGGACSPGRHQKQQGRAVSGKQPRCGHLTGYTCVTSSYARSVCTVFHVSSVSVKLGGKRQQEAGRTEGSALGQWLRGRQLV